MNPLLVAAHRAFEHAYAPYSKFRVGTAVRSASGKIYAGGNVENASFPVGNCAEASAIAAMVAAGERRIVEVLVLAGGERLCTPCGGCRQRLAEFAAADVPVHLADLGGIRQTTTLGELLPWAFTFEHEQTMTSPSLEIIRARAPGFTPQIALLLGSGLSGIAAAIEAPVAIAYDDLPTFARPGVEGHAGRLLLGRLAGVPVACLQGRVHLYEGGPAALINAPIRTLRQLGCSTLILTNAAGSLRPEVGPGTLVMLEDHINLLGANPLVGPNDEAVGPRFPDMSEVYSSAWRARAAAVAARLEIPLARGVYLATLGPNFETPAEIRAFRTLGADLVGMSTVPEAISARHAGLDVLGFSIVTNLAAGLHAAPLSHDETLSVAGGAAQSLGRLLTALLEEVAHGPAAG